MSENKYLKEHPKAKRNLKIIGFIALFLGIVLLVIGMVDFFKSFLSQGEHMPSLFFLNFIGIPLIGIGSACLRFGFLKEINEYTSSEVTPVATDATNYILNGTREELSKTIKSTKQTNICPNCQKENDPSAAFCNNCGTKLKSVCPHCGKENPSGAKFCSFCGKEL